MAGKMGMSIGQHMQQTLRMTPQLQQAIKLLQLSRMDFETAIRKEMEENPILEELQEGPEDQTHGDTEQVADSNASEASEIQQGQDPTKQDEFDWENYLDSTYKPPRDSGIGGSEEIMNYENIISSSQSLYDHLIWQLNLFGFNDEERALAAILISYVDDDGYIKTPFEVIAQDEGVDAKELEEILPFIQEFDPAGVGARNLQECLLIQARHLQEDTHDLVNLITNHLKDLEKKNYEGIAKVLSKDLEDVIAMCKIIYEMDPKPGRAYLTNDTQYIMPDVYVAKVGDEYVVSLNEEGLPRLKISNFYKNTLKDGLSKERAATEKAALEKMNPESSTAESSGESQAQDYIRDKLKAAVFLIKSIHQRQRTIFRVTESIVKHQRDFFERGPGYLKPMILRDIAEDIGIHESTVSRVTSNKYLHSPRGIFELKYFFNSGISKSGGESLASESVKLKIRDLVAKEDPKSPLSDQRIVELLKGEGIEIARRTVAKYRDVLGVLPSSKRKKYF